ncbi:MAG: succinate dehydrogenase, cytochrome b556 subunit [Pseudomonadota bacterium]
MNDTRPVNLDLNTIQLPITAITSILTRVSGVINFVSAGIMLYLLGLSLSGPEGFDDAKALLTMPLAKLVIWGILAVSIYHALAGIKHLVGDFGYGETLEGGVLGSRIIIALSLVLIAAAGLWVLSW